MKPGRYDLSITRGDDYQKTIFFLMQSEDSNGNDILTEQDYSAAEWSAQYRRNADDTQPVDFTIDTTNAASGVIVISLTAAQTAVLKCDGVWDLQRVLAGNTSTRIAGTARLIRDVTRSTG